MFGSPDNRGWPTPARPVVRVKLHFGAATDGKLLKNFSAATRIGRSLFVAADERAAIERLSDAGDRWSDHRRLQIGDFLDVDDGEAEADIEGLAAGEGWLWVLGSHARTRPKLEKEEGECIDLDRLCNLNDTRGRCLLARLPLVEEAGGWLPVKADGKRRAGMLPQGKNGGALAKALKHDPLIGPFTRIPAKEGGLDIEGIAVCGDRVALGLRGPVIATHAVLLELEVETKKSGRLSLRGKPVKRLIAMEGLGIRDFKRCGDDLLILAGPTTALSGPCALYRWQGWAQDPPQDKSKVRLHRPDRLFDIPFGRGFDHPEGLALWEEEGKRGILVIYDSPAKDRLDRAGLAIEADLFDLPS